MDSILNQSYQDFEVIILDDCSTDDSRSVIENYRSNPKISNIVYNQENSGSPFIQWNKGVRLSKGSLIWIAESDDYCELTFLEETVAKMESNPSIGLVYAQSLERDEITGEESISFAHSLKFKRFFEHSYFEKGRREVSEKLAYENTIPNASSVLFRKAIFDQVGGADETMRLCGDWFLWIKILLVSDVYFIAEPLNVFRLTSISVRNRYSKVQTFSERMKILNWMRKSRIHGIRGQQIKLTRSLLNSFKINEIRTPIKMVVRNNGLFSSIINIPFAFMLSFFDRITGNFSRMRGKLAS
jgi:glycosyltransferase involved in cell wall biosynthesis